MTDRSQTGMGWRESVWNQRPAVGPRPLGRRGLALGATGVASGQRRREAIENGATSVPGFVAASWVRPAQRRYRSGNRRLMWLLEWMTAKAWPLSVMDEMCSWLEEGSAASRVFVGCAAAATMAALLTLHGAALYGLQSMTLLPVFGGHGVLALTAASFLLGVTLLPAVLGQVVGVLLRFYVLVNLCTLAAVVGYGGWLLYSYAKF
jgi:hypothetical protein